MSDHVFQDVLSIQPGATTDGCKIDISNITFHRTGSGLVWNMNTDGASIKFYNTGEQDADSRLEFNIRDNGNEYFRWTETRSGGSSDTELMKLLPNDATNGLTFRGNKVWHAGNDGSNSGLLADSVDGLQGNQFLRSDTNDTMSGNLTVGGDVIANNLSTLSHAAETYNITSKIQTTNGKQILAPEFSPTGAPPVSPWGVYYCPWSLQWFAYTNFGSLSRSNDGSSWTTCKMIGMGNCSFKSMGSGRLPNGTVRLYAKLNNGFKGTAPGSAVYSDDYGDTWGSSSLVGGVSYYAGDSSDSHQYTLISSDATGNSGFAFGSYGYGLSYRREYYYDAASNQAMRRNWVRYALSRHYYTDTTIQGNDFLRTVSYFGNTSSVSNGFHLLSDAEIDQIFLPVGNWWTNGNTFDQRHSHSWYHWYPNGGYLYNYEADIMFLYGSTWTPSSTIMMTIGGLRHMHRHKAAGGTINSSFISSCPVKCFVTYHNQYISGGGLLIGGSHGYNGMKLWNIETPHGALIQSHGNGYFMPKEWYSTTSGIQKWADYDGIPRPNEKQIRNISGMSGYYGEAYKENPYDANNDNILFTMNDGRIRVITGAQMAQFSKDGTQPPTVYYNETATVGGVANTDVSGESSNTSSDMRSYVSRYAMAMDRSRKVGVGTNGAATTHVIKSSYTGPLDVWQNTFSNGLTVPQVIAAFNHTESDRTCLVFPSTYNKTSINDIDVDQSGDWRSNGAWNPSSGYSLQYNARNDPLFSMDNNRSPVIHGSRSTRPTTWFPNSTTWTVRTSETTNLAPGHYGHFLEYKDSTNVSSMGKVFPGTNEEYNPHWNKMQTSDGNWWFLKANRENRSSATKTTNYPGGAYQYYWEPWLGDGSTYDGYSWVYNSGSAYAGWTWGKAWYAWDWNNSNREFNTSYDKDAQWGFDMYPRWVFLPGSTFSSDRATWDSWYGNGTTNWSTSRIQGRWYPDSGDRLTLWGHNHYNVTEAVFHHSNYWKFELHLMNRSPTRRLGSTPNDSRKLLDLVNVSQTSSSTNGTAFKIDFSNSSNDFDGKTIENFLKSKVDSATVDSWAIVDSSDSSRKAWVLEIRAVYQPDTSKYIKKWLEVRTGTVRWPDEPEANQIDRTGVTPGYQNGYYWNSQLPTGHQFNYTYGDANLVFGVTRRSTFDNWDSSSASSTATWLSNMKSDYNNSETHDQIEAAGRGYGKTAGSNSNAYFPETYICAIGGNMAGGLFTAYSTPNTNSTTRNNSRRYDYLTFVFIDSNNKVNLKKFTPPIANQARSFTWRHLTHNNKLYAFGTGSYTGKLYVASMAGLNRTSSIISPSWTELTAGTTGLSYPADIVYSVALSKYMLVGESGLFVTSADGVSNWISELRPQYNFSTATSTGLYKDPGNDLHFLIDANKRMSVDGTKVSFLPQTNYTAKVIMPNLPTSKPSQTGMLWNNNGTLSVS